MRAMRWMSGSCAHTGHEGARHTQSEGGWAQRHGSCTAAEAGWAHPTEAARLDAPTNCGRLGTATEVGWVWWPHHW
eukprot:895353-Prymnesium_polylepis.1